MRCNQFMGLNEEAEAYLTKYGLQADCRPCPHCGRNIDRMYVKEPYTMWTGMFDEKYPLHKHYLENGRFVKEVVQAEPWSSGPVLFLCLEDENGIRMLEWSQEKIDNA